MIAIAAQQRDLAVFHQVEAVVGKLPLRAVTAAVHAVGKVNRPVRLHHHVIRAAEKLALVAIRQRRARAVFFEAYQRPVRLMIRRPCGSRARPLEPISRIANRPATVCWPAFKLLLPVNPLRSRNTSFTHTGPSVSPKCSPRTSRGESAVRMESSAGSRRTRL